MALLDEANTASYGNPTVTHVKLGVGTRPGILVSGHDLRDLKELLEQTKALCSKLLMSDIACGASLCAAALESASLNVFVNTKMLSDEDAKPIDDEADAMLAQYLPRARKITDEIMNTLRGRS